LARTTCPYAIQAAISDLHLQQPRDWRQIAALYNALSIQTGSSVVELNRAIAVAELDGPEAGPVKIARSAAPPGHAVAKVAACRRAAAFTDTVPASAV
jgi:predicted RNA polymerase sigma factor